MAEVALGALGALSSILQITNSLIDSTRELRKSIKTAKAAPKEMKIFYTEASIFTLLIETFHDLAKDAPKPAGLEAIRQRDRLLGNIEQQCDVVKDGVEELVSKFDRTYGGGSGTRVMTVWARVLWVIRRPDMEQLHLQMNNTKMTLSSLTLLFQLEDAKQRGSNTERIHRLKRQLKEARKGMEQAREELQEYIYKQYIMDNRSSEKMDDMLGNTRVIEDFVDQALDADSQRRREERGQKRAQREERTPSHDPVALHFGERGRRPPSPPDDPDQLGTGPSRPKSPGPGTPPGDVGEGVIISNAGSLQFPPATNGALQNELVEEARPRSFSRSTHNVQQGLPTPPLPVIALEHASPPPSPPTTPPDNGLQQNQLPEETQPRESRCPSPEVRKHSPVSPSAATQLVNDLLHDLLRDELTREARPPGHSMSSLGVERQSPLPSPPPAVPPRPEPRRRRRRALISEERGYWPTDAKRYVTNTANDVPPPKTQPKETPQQQQPLQGRPMRLARDERALSSHTRAEQRLRQAQEEDALPNQLQKESRRERTLEESRRRSSRSRKRRKGAFSSPPSEDEKTTPERK
ncbi:hypothetical protein PG993_000657 [Apiospora rasikravindrae]|uniref:Fungal N-terminal domain-containing protein n=1 Tax=Apiospora rasikravindrae TaxID=990691 RepID=A0ABR1UBG9_9PEZI